MLDSQRYEQLRLKLKSARLSANIHQEVLAKPLKRPQSYISKIESGERNIDVIELIHYVKALEIDPNNFFQILIELFD